MVTLPQSKTLTNGATILVGEAKNWNLSSQLRLTGTVFMYMDAAHMAIGPSASIKSYPINETVANTISVGALQAAVENAAIAKYKHS